jgi:hypothetical protein
MPMTRLLKIIQIDKIAKYLGPGVIYEPWFTGSPEICELRKNGNHKIIPNFL